jgi:hypothetical protein
LRERDLKVLRKMNLCPEREKAVRLLQLRSYGDSSETGVYMCDFFFFLLHSIFHGFAAKLTERERQRLASECSKNILLYDFPKE